MTPYLLPAVAEIASVLTSLFLESFMRFKFALTCLAVLALAGCDLANREKVLRIGVAQPLSGQQASLGQDAANGALLAAEDLMAENFRIDGKVYKIEIVPVDDQANPDVAKKVAEELIAKDVSAVVGHMNSGASIAAAPLYAERNIALISPSSTNPKFTRLGLKNTFRMVANDALQGQAMGQHAIEALGARKVALIDDGTTYGRGLAQEASEALRARKVPISVQASTDDKRTQFTDFVAALKKDKPDAILVVLNDFQVIALVKQLKQEGLGSVPLVGGDFLKTDNVAKESALMNGLHVTSPILEASDLSGGRDFLARFQNKFKAKPVYCAPYAYDAVRVIARAASAAGSTDPKDILNMIGKRETFNTVSSLIQFDNYGDPKYGQVAVYRLDNGRWLFQAASSNWEVPK
jgi:branched-chain amino acid transport system substrate-binding protein